MRDPDRQDDKVRKIARDESITQCNVREAEEHIGVVHGGLVRGVEVFGKWKNILMSVAVLQMN